MEVSGRQEKTLEFLVPQFSSLVTLWIKENPHPWNEILLKRLMIKVLLILFSFQKDHLCTFPLIWSNGIYYSRDFYPLFPPRHLFLEVQYSLELYFFLVPFQMPQLLPTGEKAIWYYSYLKHTNENEEKKST